MPSSMIMIHKDFLRTAECVQSIDSIQQSGFLYSRLNSAPWNRKNRMERTLWIRCEVTRTLWAIFSSFYNKTTPGLRGAYLYI